MCIGKPSIVPFQKKEPTEAPTFNGGTDLVLTEQDSEDITADMMAAPDAQPEKAFIVLHGIGRIARYQMHWIDNTRFQGGVALHVGESTIKAWRKSPNGRTLRLKLIEDISDTDYDEKGNIPDSIYDKVCGLAGIVKESPVKTAAVLRSMASDVDDLVKELGPEAAARLYEALGKRVKRTPRNG